MSGTGGLFFHFPYYHARELPAPPFLPCPFRVEFVVAVAAHLAPRAGLAHLELLLRQFLSAIPTSHRFHRFTLIVLMAVCVNQFCVHLCHLWL